MELDLLGRRAEIASKRVVAGFDGFADTIARVIRETAGADHPESYFPTIRSFGEYLIAQAEKSCSLELKVQTRQLGGNLPYVSRAAGLLGLDVTCIGMLGEGAPDPLFQEMPCRLYAFAAPGESTCLEFQDGKVFLAPQYRLSADPWQLVQNATDGRAGELFADSDLLALLNWSELPFAQSLWEHVYRESLADRPPQMDRWAFFDLCDCTRRPAKELEAVLALMGRFAEKRRAVLSLNENEALVTARAVALEPRDLAGIGEALRERFGITEVLIHTLRESLLCTPRGVTRQATRFIPAPRISTGAGDHFNAAACLGAVLELSDEERLTLSNRFSSLYVETGKTPSLESL